MSEKIGTDDSSTETDSVESVRQLTIEEARRQYDDEEARRSSVELKIGTIITIDALIISLVSVFSLEGIFTTLSTLPALLSVIFGLWALRTRGYNRPGKPLGDFFQYGNVTVEEQRKQLLLDYIVAIEGNEDAESEDDRKVGNNTKNNKKYIYFDACVLLTALSLLSILIIAIVNSF